VPENQEELKQQLREQEKQIQDLKYSEDIGRLEIGGRDRIGKKGKGVFCRDI
jgi:hypothetical protein